MIALLGPGGDHVLRALAGSRSLLTFDFDGTLAPLVADRHRAVLRPRTRALLARASRLYPCAVISGRARDDVAQRLIGTGIVHIVGNHGLEDMSRRPRAVAPVRRALALLRDGLDGQAGVDIEDKGATLAVHYRHAANRARVRARIREVLAPLLPSLRVVAGLFVENVLPPGAKDKGTALAALWQRLDVDAALFVGDDDTDEHAFRLAASRPLVAVRVGARARTHAAYVLKRQRDVDDLLVRLVELRTPGR